MLVVFYPNLNNIEIKVQIFNDLCYALLANKQYERNIQNNKRF